MPITKRTKSKLRKCIAVFLLFTLLNQMFAPSVAFALTAGPTAPEATNFEPIDTTDMVNPLTGDFTYNLPLLEVPGPEGGYPLALSYHADIQPNEDASWVGLGWSLNPGAIARNVNGYADDWSNNDLGVHRYWPGGVTKTTSYSVGITIPQSGDAVSVSFGLSFAQDTYKGFGVGFSVGAGFGFGEHSPFGVNASIGMKPYGEMYAGAGLSVSSSSPEAGLTTSIGIGVSTNFKSVNVGASGRISFSASKEQPVSINLLGVSLSSSQTTASITVGNGAANWVNNANEGKIQTESEGWSFDFPVVYVTLGVSYQQTRYWSDVTDESIVSGVLHNRTDVASDVSNFDDIDYDNYSLIDVNHNNIVDNPDPTKQVGGTFPNFDDYSVTAQGLSGNMRPYAFSAVLYNENRTNDLDHSDDVVAGIRSITGVTRTKWQFRFMNDFSNSYRQGSPWSDTNYDFDTTPQYGNNDDTYGYDPTTNRLEGSKHIEYFTNDEIASGVAAARGFIDCQAGGFTRPTSAAGNSQAGVQIGGFMITNASGVTYHYALPAYSSNENVFTNKVGEPTNFNSLTKNGQYAYTWYLTAITGPDYVSRGTSTEQQHGLIDKNDWGYWVKFDYGKWTDNYVWRNPSQGTIVDVDKKFESVSSGTKELYYMDAIETRTNTAIFEKEIRADGKGLSSYGVHDLAAPFGVYINYVKNAAGNAGAAYAPFYPVPTLRLKDILLFQNDQLNVSVNDLRSYDTKYGGQYTYTATQPNSDGTFNSIHDNIFHGENVIDTFDISSSPINNNCLRKIAFNYDYSLCPNTINSSDVSYPTTLNSDGTYTPPPLLGKLTLLSIDFQGKGGSAMTPPIQFQYDLDPSDPANQGNISISQPTGLNGTITQSGSSFSVGDILKFTASDSKQYYCTLLSSQDNLTFNVLYLNAAPSTSGTGIPAVRTKNPPYNKDAYDGWGCYKSDYVTIANNENLSRMTSPVSNKATDVWSLRKIISSTGANINVNYEGDTYNRSVLNKNKAIIASSGTNDVNAGILTMTLLNPTNLDLTQLYKVGNKIGGVLLFQSNIDDPYEGIYPYIVSPLSSYPNCTVQSITGNTLTIALDPNLISSIGGASFVTGNIVNGNNINYGGGLRVKSLSVDDLEGHVYQTSYDYGMPGNSASQPSSSGVTSYEPTVFDTDQVSAYSGSLDVNGQDVVKTYRKALYGASSNLLQISHVAPAPGVTYEYIAVTQSVVLPGQTIPIAGKTMYQYDVFRPEMLGLESYSYTSTAVNGNVTIGNASYNNTSYNIANQLRQNLAIKDYTSRIGNLKRVVTYDNLGNKLTETINHYLHDDLENTPLQNQINYYEPRLASTDANPYNGVAYNNMGVIKERYGNARLVTVAVDNNKNPTQYNDLLVMSNKETFPAFQTGTTQIDYKNGTRMDQTNLAYDFYTAAITKTLIKDSYGNRFINQVTPAYMAGGSSSPAYPALGLKTHDDDDATIQHKQMLTQQASNYTFTVDANNNPLGVVTASAQTWSNGIPVLDQDGNLTTNGQSNIWRMGGTYTWMPSGSTANNTLPYALFADYYGTSNGGASNSSWKKTGEIAKYNVYSAALEAKDINTNYAATRMGYNNSKVLLTGGPARYDEIAYAGAEDALLGTGLFSNNVSKGAGTVVTDSTKAHTGVSSLSLASGAQGFSYTLSSPAPKNYSVSVWMKPTPNNQAQAQLYYAVNGGTPVIASQSLTKSAAGWYLLEMTVPSTAISSASTLLVGCTNTSAGTSYFDDFRFQPTSASTTAYVYDTQTGELTYMLGNNNLFVRYQYDAIGRLVRTYREVLGKATIPIASGVVYNYGKYNKSTSANWQNTGTTRCQQANGANNGYIDVQQKDINPLSATYNQLKWTSTTSTSSGCPIVIYARLDILSSGSITPPSNHFYYYNDYVIHLFSDPAGTVPYTLSSPLAVNYAIQQQITDANNYQYSQTVGGNKIGSAGLNYIYVGHVVTSRSQTNNLDPFNPDNSTGGQIPGGYVAPFSVINTMTLSSLPTYTIIN